MRCSLMDQELVLTMLMLRMLSEMLVDLLVCSVISLPVIKLFTLTSTMASETCLMTMIYQVKEFIKTFCQKK